MRLWWSLSELHHSLIFFRVPGKRANRGSGSSGLRLKSGSGGVVTSGLFVSVKSSRLWRFSYCTDPIQSICTPAVGGRTLCHPILHWSWRFPLQQAQDTMVSLRNGIVSMCVPGQVWGHSNSEVLGLESMAMETCNWWILFRGPTPKNAQGFDFFVLYTGNMSVPSDVFRTANTRYFASSGLQRVRSWRMQLRAWGLAFWRHEGSVICQGGRSKCRNFPNTITSHGPVGGLLQALESKSLWHIVSAANIPTVEGRLSWRSKWIAWTSLSLRRSPKGRQSQQE